MCSRYFCQWPDVLPERAVVEDRRLDLGVTPGAAHLATEPDERVVHRGAGRVPERRSRRGLREAEQPELRAEPAVVVGASALERLEMGPQVLARVKRGSIHAREHLAAGVPAPVGARDRLQRERLDPPGARRVRAPAQIGERAVGVQRHRPQRMLGIGGALQVLDQLDLVRLTLGPEALERLLGRDVLAHERLVGIDVLVHLRFDPLEVRVIDDDPLGELEVVVEAVVDRGPDRDLDARVQLEHGGREHMCGVMADQRERLLARPLGQDLERRHAVGRRRGQRPGEIAQLAVHLDRERSARQSGADRGGGVGAGGAVGQAQQRAVGKRVVHLGRDASGRSRSGVATFDGLPGTISSAGRAPPRQGGGRWFEPSIVHPITGAGQAPRISSRPRTTSWRRSRRRARTADRPRRACSTGAGSRTRARYTRRRTSFACSCDGPSSIRSVAPLATGPPPISPTPLQPAPAGPVTLRL